MFLMGIPLRNPLCSQQFFPFNMVRLAGNSLLSPILGLVLKSHLKGTAQFPGDSLYSVHRHCRNLTHQPLSLTQDISSGQTYH